MLLVSVVVSRDQAEITIIVRMLLGSVRGGANIFHFNLISLSACLSASIIEWEGGEAGQAVTIYQGLIGSAGAACASAHPRGHHITSHLAARSRSRRPRCIGRPALRDGCDWCRREEREEGGGVQVTGSCRRDWRVGTEEGTSNTQTS